MLENDGDDRFLASVEDPARAFSLVAGRRSEREAVMPGKSSHQDHPSARK